MSSVDPKDQRINQLENENKSLLDKVKMLEQNVEALTQAVLHAAKKRFGSSSEKTQVSGQLTLFGEETLFDDSEVDTHNVKIKEHYRPVRKKGDP